MTGFTRRSKSGDADPGRTQGGCRTQPQACGDRICGFLPSRRAVRRGHPPPRQDLSLHPEAGHHRQRRSAPPPSPNSTVPLSSSALESGWTMKQVRSEALYCSDYFREIMRTLLSRDQAVARSPKGDAFSDWAGLATQQQFFFSFLAAASLHPNLAASIIHASTVAALHQQQQHHKQHTSAHMCRHTAPNFFPGIGRGGRREGERDRER